MVLTPVDGALCLVDMWLFSGLSNNIFGLGDSRSVTVLILIVRALGLIDYTACRAGWSITVALSATLA
jgi:hypothetical protein